MKLYRWIVSGLGLLLLSSCQGTQSARQADASSAPQVITLTQTGCQFLETERQDHHFQTTSSQDCERINQQTLAQRKSKFKPLSLKPGSYVFRVTNQTVPYGLGFYLRGATPLQANLPKVSGGGLDKGVTKDYAVTLVPGEYVFSCPLNPTPDYPLIVR